MNKTVAMVVAVVISLGFVPGAFAADWLPRVLTGAPKPEDVAKAEKEKAKLKARPGADERRAKAKAIRENRKFTKQFNRDNRKKAKRTKLTIDESKNPHKPLRNKAKKK